jgi:NAD(P)-dependent dehydrogenase (short-subunit alcohol dehydrogenase family)
MAQDRPAALVTGSASGIGRAVALRLARLMERRATWIGRQLTKFCRRAPDLVD